MQKLLLDPDVADDAPTTPIATGYDEQHLITYLRLLHAAADGADWKEVSRIVLHIDPHRPGAPRLGNPSGACPLDGRARLSPPTSWRSTALTAP